MSRRTRLMAAAIAAAALSVAGCGSSTTKTSSSSATTPSTSTTAPAAASTSASTTTASTSGPTIGFEGVPLEQGPQLAPASTTGSSTVDGISCKPVEQLVYHIHIHLAVFDDGRLYALPPGVGIPDAQTQQTQYGPVVASGHCFYWLHTHTDDGIIHVESPIKRIYTLGNFFDVWRQPLTSDRVASLHGQITAIFNGKPWTRSPRDIPLLPHAEIQLEIGEPSPPLMTVDWSKTQL